MCASAIADVASLSELLVLYWMHLIQGMLICIKHNADDGAMLSECIKDKM
jgi:hypothetical protein